MKTIKLLALVAMLLMPLLLRAQKIQDICIFQITNKIRMNNG